MGNYAWISIFIIIIIFNLWESIHCGPCTDGKDTGQHEPEKRDDHLDTGSDVGVLLSGNDREFQYSCCGRVSSWEIYAKNEGDVQLQVWRNLGTTWELQGQNLYTVSNAEKDTKIIVTVPANEQILADDDDVIGIYCPGNPIIPYKFEGGANSGYFLDYTIGSSAAGDTYAWTNQQGGRDYAINSFQTTNSPSFSGHLTDVEFFDDTASGSLIKTVTATDADTLDTLTFSMTTTTSSFTFNAATRELRSSGNLPTTSSTTSTTTLSFRVSDNCGNSDTGQLKVKVKNNPPSITNLPGTADVSEDVTVSTLLYTVTVTDISPSDTITCSVASVSPASSDFTTGLGSGGVATTGIYIKANPTVNYDVTKRYTLTISCSDGKASDSGQFVVFLIRNQPPSITNLANGVSVALSTSTASGDAIYTVTGTDPDGDSLFYSMTCDQTPCPFQISPLTGVVKATSNLDSTAFPAYDLYVYVYDNKTLVGPRTMTLLVSNINVAPTFTNLPFSSSLSVAENLALGSQIFKVSSTDPNSKDIVTYSAVYSPTSAAAYFNFDSTTGQLSTASTLLNYEALSSTTITIAITVSDGIASNTQNLILECVDVNEAPQFDRGTYTITGNEGQAGASVGSPRFVVTDPDAGDVLSYSIDCANFIMNSATGAVTFSAEYDTDAPGVSTSETCTVTVSDGFLTDTCQLVITINDINDNTPVFTQPTYVLFAEVTTGVGATIGTITAVDGDAGINGYLSYSLDQSSLSMEYFGVQHNGAVYIKEDISSFYSGTTLIIPTTATDFGGLSGNCNVVIVIPEYVTVIYTTTPERFITFIEDTRNVAWIVVLAITIVGIASLVLFVTYKKCRCGELCMWCNERCSKQVESRQLRSDELSTY